MKDHYKTAMVTVSAALASVFLLTVPALGQSDEENAKARAAARAKNIAQARANATQILNLYDRQGKLVGTINQRDFYNQPVISPDNTRIAVVKAEPETETQDAWVIDVATGKATRITTSKPR